MQQVPGLIAKEGAAGVMAAALPDGRALAFKIADGDHVAREAVVPEALRRIGVDVDAAPDDLVNQLVMGHGREVGEIRALEWSSCSS
jgi:L-asparaginase II